MEKVTNGFEIFMKDTDGIGEAFMHAVTQEAKVSALDAKTQELAYIAVLVASKMYQGLPFHIQHAKDCGATRQEIKSAMLVPFPIMGLQVAEALPFLAEEQWE